MKHCLDIAAEMLGGPDGWQGLLHGDLKSDFQIADMRCRNAGGQLTSRQAIAAIICAWEHANPGKRAYGE